MLAIQGNYYRNLELKKVELALSIDFNAFQNVAYNESERKLNFSNALDSINYQFYDNYTIRAQDTISIGFNDVIVFFEGETITKYPKVDAIKLTHFESEIKSTLFVYKLNDASVYMN